MVSITDCITVPVVPAQAWERFLGGLHLWCDTEHFQCCKENLDRVFIDPDQGLWGEITKAGETVFWGRRK